MAIGYKRKTSLALCLMAAAQIITGCNQPASSSTEGPVGSSSSTAPEAAGGARQQAAGSQGNTSSTTEGTPAQAAEAPKEMPSAAPDKTAVSAPPQTDGTPTPIPAAAAGAQPVPAASNTAPPSGLAEGKKPEPVKEAAAPAAPAVKAKEEVPAVKIESGKPTALTFKDLYSDITVRGVNLSDQVKQLSGKKVEMTGFMAPPLTAKVNFFVLTKVALSICPFCSSDADWPTDIVVVYMPKGKEVTPTEHQVKVTGTLSVGSQTDNNTGFVSLIRIEADKLEVLP